MGEGLSKFRGPWLTPARRELLDQLVRNTKRIIVKSSMLPIQDEYDDPDDKPRHQRLLP